MRLYTPISFEQWLQNQDLRLEDGEYTKCIACDGDGEVECECECGHLHNAECGDCKGAGEINKLYLEYQNQKKEDSAKWEAYLQSNA